MLKANIDLVALASGNAASWLRIVNSYSARIRTVAARTFLAHGVEPHREEIEDVMQDVYVRLAKNNYALLRSFDENRASFGTWLGVIAHSAAIDALRARPKFVGPCGIPHEDVADSSREDGRVELPADLLTDQQIVVMRMLFDEDLDVREVAQLLNIKEQTVRSLKHKALERLRTYYKTTKPAERLDD